MKEGVIIYPHQLFEHHPALTKGRTVFLVEEPLFFTQYRFHKQKLIFHRASMKAYEQFLKKKGYDVVYVEHHRLPHTRDIAQVLHSHKIATIHLCDVVDDWLSRRLEKMAKENNLGLSWHETSLFLTDRASLDEFWKSQKSVLQHTFYVWQRKRLGVLVENGKPIGGKWSFDADNRKPLPKHIPLPEDMTPHTSTYIDEAKEYIEKHFGENYGNGEECYYAVTHEAAKKELDTFLKERFASFGDYEDAMEMSHTRLFHSVLSPYLNAGLLTPRVVLSAVLEYAETHSAPLASLEGFVRQLIGWREFIRMVYVYKGREMRTKNALMAHHALPESWWTGHTGIVPIDHLIKGLKSHAYSHHIPRLMVAGNMMTLIGADPEDCYRWFMEWYIDAYDWVMVPNVYGMALYADGGEMVTKPYVSSSKYLMKMGNYQKGDWQEVWDALYWNFIDIHRKVFLENPRSSLMVHLYEKFSQEKKDTYKEKAHAFFKAHYE
jgi:deoxyribodipyrimidine photolyase-related protein